MESVRQRKISTDCGEIPTRRALPHRSAALAHESWANGQLVWLPDTAEELL